MGSAATGFVKNNKKVTWKEFARMLAVLAVPIAMQNLLATTASMVDTIMIGSGARSPLRRLACVHR